MGGTDFVVLADNKEPDGLSKPIDLGAGHSSLKAGIEVQPSPELPLKPFPQTEPTPIPDHEPDVEIIVEKQTCTLRLASAISPPEVWNHLGTKSCQN